MLLKSKLEKIKKCLSENNVLANLEERYCYSTDASNNRHNAVVPDLVVFVETIDDIKNILKYANEYKIPIIPRGAGTNMVGACVCENGGIVLNFSRMNKILEINKSNMTARVQPGVVLEKLKMEADALNLFYPPDPSNYKVSTIGGSIAQSSGGALSFKYGTTKDYVKSLTIVTANGKVLKLGSETSKDSMGYHLNQLFVGSEGTLGVVAEATLKLIPKPEKVAVLLASFANIADLMSVVDKVLSSNIFPAAIDFMDKNAIETSEMGRKFAKTNNAEYLLIMQFDGDLGSLMALDKKVDFIINSSNCIYSEFTVETERIDEIWKARRISYAATTKLAPDVISDDLIVPRDKVALLIDYCKNIVKKYNLNMCMVGHIGDGNLHPQFAFDASNEELYRNYIDAKSEIYRKVVELGGNISAEHGIGIDKLSYFENMIDAASLSYMKMIKKIFDPNNILNPGKIFIQDR